MMKWCAKMYSWVQRGVFSLLMAIVKWKAKTVYHNQKEKKTKKQASRQFDLVLQPVGVGPFLPKCILPFLGVSYSVHVPFHRSTCEGTEWADIELMPSLCNWEKAVMLDLLAGSTFLWQSLTCTQHLMASWEAAHSLCTHPPVFCLLDWKLNLCVLCFLPFEHMCVRRTSVTHFVWVFFCGGSRQGLWMTWRFSSLAFLYCIKPKEFGDAENFWALRTSILK